MKAGRLLAAWAPAVLYMGLIWFVSSLTLGPLPLDEIPLRDKGIHLVEYAVLGFLLAHAAFRTWPRHHPLRTAALALLIAGLWGWLDEIHQAFVPGRGSDVLDLAADCLGALAGVTLRLTASAVRRAVPRFEARSERLPSRMSEG